MTPWISFPLLALLVVVQTSLAPSLEVGSARPQILLCWVIAWALIRGRTQAFSWALVGGLGLDLLSPLPMGAHVLGLSATAYLTYLTGRAIHARNVVLASGVAAIMTVVYGGILVVVAFAGGLHPQALFLMASSVLPSAVINLLVMVPVYVLLRAIDRRFPLPVAPAW